MDDLSSALSIANTALLALHGNGCKRCWKKFDARTKALIEVAINAAIIEEATGRAEASTSMAGLGRK